MNKLYALASVLLLACSSDDDGVGTLPVTDSGADVTMDAVSDVAAPKDTGPDVPVDACPALAADPVHAMYTAVDSARLINLLKQGAGVIPVALGDAGMQTISNRYSPASKTLWRTFFTQYMSSLGIAWQELPYTTQHNNGEAQGHNIEAILPGTSKDSIVIIIHYDSMGPGGSETSNPGVDDDMTGMASMMEAARLFSNPCLPRQKTIRFVATDYEEWVGPGLEGARVYATWIKDQAMKQGFNIVAAIDYEQSGWNCASDNVCAADAGGKVYDVYDCSGDGQMYKSTALGDALQLLTTTLGSPLGVSRGCLAQNSDHYAMWEIGVPSIVTSEHLPLSNPHFDYKGGDTFATIDTAFYVEIARLSIAFTAQLAGVGKL